MKQFDWKAANKRFAAFKEKLEAENQGMKIIYDGDEDPIHQWSAHGLDELEAELAAMTPEQREAARIEALARIEAA